MTASKAAPTVSLSRRGALAALGLALPALAVGTAARGGQADRIVVAGGVITEVIYALGEQDRVVGVDSTSQFPPQALQSKADIGYVRVVSAEGVLSLKPSLVLLIDGAGPPDALALIAESGVRVARIPDGQDAEGVAAKIVAIGDAIGAAEAARRLAARTSAGFRELEELRAGLKQRRRVLFVLSLQNGRALVGGRNSSADAIIALAGAENAASAIEGYKPMTDEAIIAAAPEIVLMMSRGNHRTSAEELFALPAFSQTPAAAQRRLVQMDGLYLLGFGPRTPLAARDLMAAIDPDRTLPPLTTGGAP